MREQFAKEFVTKLNGKIPDDELRTVLQELEVFVSDYEIEERQTEITPYQATEPDYYKVYMVAKKIEGTSEETLKTYNYYLKDFFEHIGKTVEQVTTNDIRVYLYDLQLRTGICNRSLDGKRLVINTFLQWCSDEGYIQKNPCKTIKPIKYEAKKREPLNGIELEMLRDACRDYREKAIIEFFYSTGCRVSEMARLVRTDVDFASGEVHLFGKGNKHRTSYLNAKAELMLKKYLFTRMDDNPSLFVSERKPHNQIKKGAIEKIVHDIGERAGIGRNVYPHLIRHTTATDAMRRGMPAPELQELLGHNKLDTTMIYAKICNENVKHDHMKYVI